MKKILITIITIITAFAFTSVNAEETEKVKDTCTVEERTRIRTLASNINAVYEPEVNIIKEQRTTDTDGNEVPEYTAEMDDYIMSVKIYNVPSEFRVKVRDRNNGRFVVLAGEDAKDGVLSVATRKVSYVNKFTVEVYANEGECFNTKLRTISVTTPRYNPVSMLGICSDIPEYYLCQRWVTYNINTEEAIKKIQTYNKKLEEKKVAEENSKKQNGLISSAISNVKKIMPIVISILVVIGLVATFVIIKRKGSVK